MKNNEMTSEDLVEVGRKITKGRGGKNNFPSSKVSVETAEDKQLVSKLLTEVMVEYKQPKVKSDEELAERLDNYFTRCAMNGQVPTVEEMCMSTGYSYSTCYDWEVGRNKGFSTETSKIIKKAKDLLKTFDAKLVIAGKMNFLAYCFRAKNYYGMVDKQEMVVTPNVNPDSDYNKEDIQARYAIDSPTFPTIDSPDSSNS